MKNTDRCHTKHRPCKSPRLPFNQKTQRHTYTHYEKESQYVQNTTMRVRYPEKKKKGSHPRTKKIHKRPPKPQIIHPCHGFPGSSKLVLYSKSISSAHRKSQGNLGPNTFEFEVEKDLFGWRESHRHHSLPVPGVYSSPSSLLLVTSYEC